MDLLISSWGQEIIICVIVDASHLMNITHALCAEVLSELYLEATATSPKLAHSVSHLQGAAGAAFQQCPINHRAPSAPLECASDLQTNIDCWVVWS